ncbi:hypothetical protein [Methylorubrum aminovorans]
MPAESTWGDQLVALLTPFSFPPQLQEDHLQQGFQPKRTIRAKPIDGLLTFKIQAIQLTGSHSLTLRTLQHSLIDKSDRSQTAWRVAPDV